MRQAWIGAAALLLAGCGGGESTEQSAAATGDVSLKNASLEEVAKQAEAAGGATRLQPGQWETRVEIGELAMPDVPAAVAGAIKDTMKSAANTTVTNCITPEEAERPQGKVFGGNSDECRYEKFEMRGGRMEGTMVCNTDRGGSMTMTTAGTFTATSFAVSNDMAMKGGEQEMTMKAKVTGRRLGECPK